jgi:hypothetical protein
MNGERIRNTTRNSTDEGEYMKGQKKRMGRIPTRQPSQCYTIQQRKMKLKQRINNSKVLHDELEELIEETFWRKSIT